MWTTLAQRYKEAFAEWKAKAPAGGPKRNAAQLAREAGVKKATLTGWGNGRVKEPKKEQAYKVAEKLSVNWQWLAHNDGPKRGDLGAAPRPKQLEGGAMTLEERAARLGEKWLVLPKKHRDRMEREMLKLAAEFDDEPEPRPTPQPSVVQLKRPPH